MSRGPRTHVRLRGPLSCLYCRNVIHVHSNVTDVHSNVTNVHLSDDIQCPSNGDMVTFLQVLEPALWREPGRKLVAVAFR